MTAWQPGVSFPDGSALVLEERLPPLHPGSGRQDGPTRFHS